jgi:hypothetical protein
MISERPLNAPIVTLRDFAGMETALRLIWAVSPYRSEWRNVSVIR